MFRSGTTLLGRMLNAHNNMVIASDSCKALLKYYRTDIAKKIGQEISPEVPLDDYYFSKDKLMLKREIQNSTFDYPFSGDHEILKNQTVSHSSPFCPKVTENIGNISGDTYKEILQSFLDIIEEQYGKGREEIVGFKDVWTDEFIGPLSKCFPDMKFIQIVRDPRAVCSSKNSRIEKYPWMFLAKQWRKLASYAKYYQNDKSLKDNHLLIYYEDIIREPEKIAKKICSFLETEYDEDMIDLTKYVDGKGDAWIQNTSYGKGEFTFDEKSIDKWKEVLREDEVQLIEILCGFEMELHNYQLINKDKSIPKSFVLAPPRVDDDKLANWIKKIVKNDELYNTIEMQKEQTRYLITYNNDGINMRAHKDIIESCFLFIDVYDSILSDKTGNQQFGTS